MNIRDLMTSRRSVRRFKTEKPTREAVEELIEMAVTAPSASNKPPWRFFVTEDRGKIDTLAEAVATAVDRIAAHVDPAFADAFRGYGDYFVHRTGHSIGEEVHGNGANIDNLETKDERKLMPGICFSIEPGIYLEGEMAVRTEINVLITLDGQVVVEGEQQEQLILIE